MVDMAGLEPALDLPQELPRGPLFLRNALPLLVTHLRRI